MVLTCMQREGVAARAQLCLLFICSTDDQVGFNGKVFAKRIHLRPRLTFSFLISELFFSRAKHTSFHFHWQLQNEANFWNTGIHLKFHFHFSEIIQISSVNTEPSQQWELFSILLWRGSWFWLFTHFGAIKSPRLRLGLFIAAKCVKSQNHPPFYTINSAIVRLSLR